MICPPVRLPSQRSTISRLGPFSRNARSGMSSTRWLLLSPRRQPAARRGRLFGSGVILDPSKFLVRLKSAGRGPTGIYVGKVKSVELGPENVALGAQGSMRKIL